MDTRLPEDAREARMLAEAVLADFDGETTSALLDASRNERLESALTDAGLAELMRSAGEETEQPTVMTAVLTMALAGSLFARPFLGDWVLGAQLAKLSDRELHAGDGSRIGLTANLRDVATGSDTKMVVFDAHGGSEVLCVDRTDDGTRSTIRAYAIPSKCEEIHHDLTRTCTMVDGLTDELSTWSADIDSEEYRRWHTRALTMIAADTVGVMEGALKRALAYVEVREQFGRPIGTFQAIQHWAAEMAVSVEASRAVSIRAAWSCDELDWREADYWARAAKAYASMSAVSVAEGCLQFFGGTGMTWDAVPHLYLRRSAFDAAILGGWSEHALAMGDELLGETR